MKKKLLAILTGAAITATCFSALAACGDGKSGNSGNSGNSNTEQSGNSNSGSSNTEQSGNSNSGNSNTEQSGGIENISEQQFKNALSVFSTEDYWQYEYEIAIPEEMHYDYDTQKTWCMFDGNNKILHLEAIQTGSDTVASSTMEQYIVADGKSLTTYIAGELNMENEQLTNPWSISFSESFDTAALAEKALRSFGNAVGAFIELPCKTEENGKDKFLSDLYDKLIFDETDKSYSIKVIYNISDINDSFPAGSSLTITSPEESTLEVSFKFIFENGKIKTLTCDYLSKLSEISDALDMLPDEITYNFSYDEISVTLPEEVKSAPKL